MPPRPWRRPTEPPRDTSTPGDARLTAARRAHGRREANRWRWVLGGAAVLGVLAAVALYTRRPDAPAASTLPLDCVRAYARARTPAESAAVDGRTTSITRRSGAGPNCGYYRGRARLDSLAARADAQPGS